MDATNARQALESLIGDADLLKSLPQIRAAAEAIWVPEIRVVTPFTDHGMEHSKRLVPHALDLLQENRVKELTGTEAFLLLAGIFLHDIGMQCDVRMWPNIRRAAEALGADFGGLFEVPHGGPLTGEEQQAIRRNHHYLSAAWIQYARRTGETVLGPAVQSIPGLLALDLMDVCLYHSKMDIRQCPEECKQPGGGRKQLVAALLRLTDELDTDWHRGTHHTAGTFGMDPGDAVYWWIHGRTTVGFDHNHSFVSLVVGLNAEDDHDCGAAIRRELDGLREKNRHTVDILHRNGVFIALDPRVEQAETEPRLPPDIRDQIRRLGQPPSNGAADQLRLWSVVALRPCLDAVGPSPSRARGYDGYVDLRCYLHSPVKAMGQADQPIHGLDTFTDGWLQQDGTTLLAVIGEFGSGKSWFCRHYVRRQLQRYLADPLHERLPLLIPLRAFREGDALQQVLARALSEEYGLSLQDPELDVLRERNYRGDLVLLLDGFDEMPGAPGTDALVGRFWQLSGLFEGKSKVVLTSRIECFRYAVEQERTQHDPAFVQHNILGSRQFEVVHLLPFEDGDVRHVIRQRLGTEAGTPIEQIIQRNHDLAQLAHRPLLIDLLLTTVDWEHAVVMPRTPAQVYLYATSSLLRRHAESSVPGIGMAEKLHFLCGLAWDMVTRRRARVHRDEIPALIQCLFRERVSAAALADWGEEMCERTLLHSDPSGHVEFAHRSMAEYFAALRLMNALGCLPSRYADAYLEPATPGRQSIDEEPEAGAQRRGGISERTETIPEHRADETLPRVALMFAAGMASDSPDTLAELCRLSWDQSGVVAWNALSLLPFMAEGENADLLARTLLELSKGHPLRSGVAWVLGEFVGASKETRDAACAALRRTAREFVREFAKDPTATGDAWWESAFALEKLGDLGLRKGRQGDEPIEFLSQDMPGRWEIADALRSLVATLRNPSSKISQRDIAAIAHQARPEHAAIIFDALHRYMGPLVGDTVSRRSYYVVWLCGHLGLADSLPYVIAAATEHPFRSVHNCACEALGKIGIKTAAVVSALERGLQDDYYRARYHAAWSLRELRAVEALPALLVAIAKEEVKAVSDEMQRTSDALKGMARYAYTA